VDGRKYCIEGQKDTAVCLPNSDTTTEGKCVSCRQGHLNTAIQEGRLKDVARIVHLKSTCEPKSQGPNPVPERKKNTTKEVRYLRWFLESSFVFEQKNVGDKCSASPGLIKARAYLNVLMKVHFRKRDDGNISLSTPGMEGVEEEKLYEAVRAQLNDDNHKKWWEDKLKGIEKGKSLFWEVYCSREKGLICVERKCTDCGNEEVKKNENLFEACHPEEVPKGKRKEGDGSSGAQDGKYMPEFTPALGVLCSTILPSIRWWW
jgi:hypothetical protein